MPDLSRDRISYPVTNERNLADPLSPLPPAPQPAPDIYEKRAADMFECCHRAGLSGDLQRIKSATAELARLYRNQR